LIKGMSAEIGVSAQFPTRTTNAKLRDSPGLTEIGVRGTLIVDRLE
jgi:hypothetical protein